MSTQTSRFILQKREFTGGTEPLCFSYGYGVIFTNKHSGTDLILAFYSTLLHVSSVYPMHT